MNCRLVALARDPETADCMSEAAPAVPVPAAGEGVAATAPSTNCIACRYKLEAVLKKGWRYAQCRGCKNDISIGRIRLGCAGGSSNFVWWCIDCTTAEIAESVLSAVGGVERVDGFLTLATEQQNGVKASFAKSKGRIGSADTSMSIQDYRVEVAAKKGWKYAQCKWCKNNLEKDQLRFRAPLELPHARSRPVVVGEEGWGKCGWWCIACIPEDYRRHIEKTGCIDEINGFSALPSTLQYEFRNAFGKSLKRPVEQGSEPSADGSQAKKARTDVCPAEHVLQQFCTPALLRSLPAELRELLQEENYKATVMLEDVALSPAPAAPPEKTELEKEKAQAAAEVDRILGCKTVEHVLGGGSKDEQLREFRRIALLLHPDKQRVVSGGNDDRPGLAMRLALAARTKARKIM